MTLIFELDLYPSINQSINFIAGSLVHKNQHAKYLGQRSFPSKVIVLAQKHTQ